MAGIPISAIDNWAARRREEIARDQAAYERAHPCDEDNRCRMSPRCRHFGGCRVAVALDRSVGPVQFTKETGAPWRG